MKSCRRSTCCRNDRKLKSLEGLRVVTRSLRKDTCMVASSMSMPWCQPKVSCFSRKMADSSGAVPWARRSCRAMARPRLEGPNPTPTRSWTMMGSWSLRDTLVPSGWGSALVGRRTDTSVSGGDRGRPERAEGLFGGEDGAAPSGRVTQGRAVLLGAEVGQRVGDHERLDVPHERVGGG